MSQSPHVSWNFTDKTVAIAGATGAIVRTILAAAARSQGVRFVLHARDGAALEQVAAGVRRTGATVETVVADPTTETAAVAEDFAAHTDIDVLINNAGMYWPGGDLSVADDDMRTACAVDAMVTLATIQAVLPGMQSRGYGRVVTISPNAGEFGQSLDPAHAPYAVSKAALNAMTFLTARAVRGDVKVNAMCPGWVRTKIDGAGPTRSLENGADTALWLATLPTDGPNGGFFRDRQPIAW